MIDWDEVRLQVLRAEADRHQGKLSKPTTRDTLLWAARELLAQRNTPTLCCWGIATSDRCQKTATWSGIFDGIPTGLTWCNEHKVNSDLPRHGLEPRPNA